MPLTVTALIAGLAMLIGGGNLLVRGASGIARPMLLLSLILLPISISSMRKITRAEGAMLLAGYCTYVSLRAVFFG